MVEHTLSMYKVLGQLLKARQQKKTKEGMKKEEREATLQHVREIVQVENSQRMWKAMKERIRTAAKAEKRENA